jgi:tRNA (guanine37-N1)-methyltransferase
MQFDIVTIFPDFFAGPLDYGIVRRARDSNLINVCVHDLRTFTHDRHRTVDDRPFGGGEGMVLKPEPLFEAVESLLKHSATSAQHAAPFPVETSAAEVAADIGDTIGLEPLPTAPRGAAPPAIVPERTANQELALAKTAIVLLSASGKLFRQETARRFAQLDRIILLCGRYEGVDERVAEHLATDELSIGDFVLSGGELASALIMDTVTRLIPGVLGNQDSAINESFSDAESSPIPEIATYESAIASQRSPTTRRVFLDFPHYTRPADFRGWTVPEILLGGNHKEILKWRHQKALEKTRRNRPDLP